MSPKPTRFLDFVVLPLPSRNRASITLGFIIPTSHEGDARTPYLSCPNFAVVYKLGSFIAALSYR